MGEQHRCDDRSPITEYEVVLDDEKGRKTTLEELLGNNPMSLDKVIDKLWKFIIGNKYLKVKKREC